MIVKMADWRFRVDKAATWEQTTRYSEDHCECAYCRNYYDAVDMTYPRLRGFLSEFGINLDGPSELMPFSPTLMLACYRVRGEILQWGRAQLATSGITVLPEAGEEGSFLLWIGEVELPWVQREAIEDVVSPANMPEFMQRMGQVWDLRHGKSLVSS